MTGYSLSRRLGAEALGTALLLATVVGSGIMGTRMTDGDPGLTLLANSLATGCMLVVLILVFAPVSAAHFNPAVTLAAWLNRQLPARYALLYLLAQVAGAMLGVVAAHLMFGEAAITLGEIERSGGNLWFSEAIATFGLVLVILATAEYGIPRVAAAVGLYITGAYWFTSSTSFANPAVTIARAFTDSFAGIRPTDVLIFVAMQFVGGILAVAWWRWQESRSR